MVMLVWIQVAILFGAGALTMRVARLFGGWTRLVTIILLVGSCALTLFVILMTGGSALSLYPASILVGQLAVRPLRRPLLVLAPVERPTPMNPNSASTRSDA